MLGNATDADEVSTRIFGYNVIDCRGGSDTIVSVPFHLRAAFAGSVEGTPAVNGTRASVVVEGAPGFEIDQFSDEPHYLQITGDSARAGWFFRIVSNQSDSLEIDLADLNLAGVQSGDTFEVIPCWTLGNLFPSTNATIYKSFGLLLNRRRTEILFFDHDSANIDLAPNRKFFQSSTGWHEVAPGFPSAEDVVILPGSSFVIRHPPGFATTRFVAQKWADSEDRPYVLQSDETEWRDNHLGSQRPVPVKLSDLDLGPPAFVESPSTAPEERADELHLFDNSTAAINRHASSTYFRVAGHWHRDTAGFPLADDDEVSAGTGMMIRKAPNSGAVHTVWINTPRY
ncbi:MAG: TIGR02597 family protein [Verrucomicrobiae bacterium]|nr:TIGR02597 family protein [Verrucomicrobiae bacterium]